MKTSGGVFFLAVPALIVTSLCMSAAADITSSPCFKAATADFKASSYETTMTSDGKTSVVDIQKPDRIHEKGPGNEMIAIGKQTWMRFNGGPWKSYPNMNMGSVASMDPSSFIKPQGTGTCTDAGPGMFHGTPAHVYKGAWTGQHGTSNTTIYVMPDGYVHHMDITTSRGPMSFDISRFNAVTVSPP